MGNSTTRSAARWTARAWPVPLRHALVLMLACALAGCVSARNTAPAVENATVPGFSPCCVAPKQFPRWLIALAEPLANVLASSTPVFSVHAGLLGNEQGRRPIMQAVRPLDIVLLGSWNGPAARFLPGLLGHALVYLGSERELRGLGVWNDPQVRPHQDEIRAGKVFIEAVSPRVRLVTPADAIHSDVAVILRPHLPGGSARKRRAVDDFMAHLGTPFDASFDASNAARLFCSELVCHVLPELHLPRQVIYGRETILTDEIAAVALHGGSRLSFVRYVRGRPDGVEIAPASQLRRDIVAEWRKMVGKGRVAGAEAKP